MWWALKVNGEIQVVKQFDSRPSAWDFNWYFFSENQYDIVRVNIVEAQ